MESSTQRDLLQFKNTFSESGEVSWEKYLPTTLVNGYQVEMGTFDEIMGFARAHLQEIYSPIDPQTDYRWLENHPNKKMFYEKFSTIFLFKENKVTVGFHVINLSDWSTYYHRNVSILTSHQNNKLWQHWFKYLVGILKANNIHRVECDVSPGNTKKIHVLNKMGFRITGFTTSERWGAVIKFTKFLNSEYENLFHKNLCLGWLDSWQNDVRRKNEYS